MTDPIIHYAIPPLEQKEFLHLDEEQNIDLQKYINGIAEAAVPVDATAVAVAPADLVNRLTDLVSAANDDSSWQRKEQAGNALFTTKADSTLTTPALTPVPSRDGTSGTTTPTKVDYLPTFTREDTLVYNIISNNPIRIASGHTTLGDMDDALRSINSLIETLKSCPQGQYEQGVSPGFETIPQSNQQWLKKNDVDIYETLPSVNAHNARGPPIPVPSPAAAVRYFAAIRDTWMERRRCLEGMGGHQLKNWAESPFCSCISAWSHLRGHILWQLSNQSLEQDMVREASLATTEHLSRGPKEWDQLYAPYFCSTPEEAAHIYTPNTGVRVMLGREDYLETFIDLALHTEHTLDISTCYMFAECPAQRYILLDLLPYLAKVKGIKVRVLCDMKPIEARILMSVLKPKTTGAAKTTASILQDAADWAFVDRLPEGAPPVSRDAKESVNALDFFPKILEKANSIANGTYEIRWWCARDAKKHYRIKSHVKCVVFDASRALNGTSSGMALLGGSNLCPKAIDSDLDILIGEKKVVNKVGETFEWLWDYMSASKEVSVKSAENRAIDLHEELKNEEPEAAATFGGFPQQAWMDECRVAYVRCESSSVGITDEIFRHVLGAIASARVSITMCMGHMNIPTPLAEQLAQAVQRGVRVRLLVNSLASCDLRVNQRDLFNSLKNLMDVAPGVEIWSTALRSDRPGVAVEDDMLGEDRNAPPEYAPFLHSKYTVVDGKWSALGSWNVWTRCAFYEIEHELLIESKTVAKHLQEKFERERKEWCVLLESPKHCNLYCPKGCSLCEPFGNFFP